MSEDGASGAATARNPRDQSMRGYLQQLEQSGQIVRIDKEVDPATNFAAIDWKIYDQQGKGTIFTNLKGHPGWQACSQVLADRRKWSMALNLTEDELLTGMSSGLKTNIEPGMDFLFDKLHVYYYDYYYYF